MPESRVGRWERIRARKLAGCFLGLQSPNVAELLAHAGFEWLAHGGRGGHQSGHGSR